MRTPDLTGSSFHRLTVLRRSARNGQNIYWDCTCVCGSLLSVSTSHLTTGHTRSCGCLQRESAAARATHGKSRTAIYNIWSGIIGRCTNPNLPGYRFYGARGITVCDRWLSFENFYADMGERPRGMSLERVDNDGAYAPSNCKWATKDVQANNTRASKFLTLGARTQTMAQWAAELGWGHSKIHQRLKRGWAVERALTTP